jgi:ornithine cyclodeaminase/alanine dehydrogenase
MSEKTTLLLNRSDIAGMLDFKDYFDAVEAAFKSYGEGKTLGQGIMHLDSPDGVFHIKGGGLKLERTYVGLKTVGAFMQNTSRYGLPNILGTITLCDGDNGYPLAVMNGGEITRQRTAAAAAVAAKYLARKDSHVATICGCGTQGRVQLKGMKYVLPITKAFAYDVEAKQVEQYVKEMSQELGIEVQPTTDLAAALAQSDVAVTCTPSRQFYLKKAYVRPGTFIAAMGADSANKQELEPALLASAKLVVDIIDQCAHVGELHHALDAGLMKPTDVYAELGEVVAGKKPGRRSKDEIIIFDSTGTAMQDVASAALAYTRATAKKIGVTVNLMA